MINSKRFSISKRIEILNKSNSIVQKTKLKILNSFEKSVHPYMYLFIAAERKKKNRNSINPFEKQIGNERHHLEELQILATTSYD